jgi:GNAT superfamily N-acetyltransferase
MADLKIRLATGADLPVLRAIMAAAIAENLKPFLPPELIRASEKVMGLDTTLVEDETYWIVHAAGEPAGCGGWSRRNTLYGGDHTGGRNAALLNPAVDAARVRAMYTHPSFLRQGIGRLILDSCEAAARSEGFDRLQLAATLAGAAIPRVRLPGDRAFHGRRRAADPDGETDHEIRLVRGSPKRCLNIAPRRGEGAIHDIAGVEHTTWLKTKDLSLFIRAGPMFDAAWHDDAISRHHGNDAIPEFDAKHALPDHEKLVLVFMGVPGKFALHLYELYLLAVQSSYDFGTPMLREQGEFLVQIDFFRHANAPIRPDQSTRKPARVAM